MGKKAFVLGAVMVAGTAVAGGSVAMATPDSVPSVQVAPTSQAASWGVHVTENGVNIRSAPNTTNSTILGIASAGQHFEAVRSGPLGEPYGPVCGMGPNDSWVEVQYGAGTAFIADSCVDGDIPPAPTEPPR